MEAYKNKATYLIAGNVKKYIQTVKKRRIKLNKDEVKF